MTHLIQELKSKIENGINWEKAVVDCISDWDISEEFYRGYKYKYWINNEAFDWMTLTERLGSAIKSYLNKKKSFINKSYRFSIYIFFYIWDTTYRGVDDNI